MPVEARISPIWKNQKLAIAIFCLAISAWFFYDGAIGWPASNERWLAHEGFVTKKTLEEWPPYALRHGWVKQPPEKLHDSGDIIGQYVIAGLAFSIGILVLTYWLTQKSRVLRMDDEAVYTASGTRVPFDAVTAVNRKKWETKGIARVRYSLEGRTREFVVDDYKFDTAPTRQILEEIEKRLPLRKASEAAVPPGKAE